MLLPLTSRRYWYISSYMILSLFMPLLNAGFEKLTRKEARRLLVGFFLLVSVFGNLNIDRTDPFCMSTGASPLWMINLYLIGAYARKYDVPSNIRFTWAGAALALCIAVNVLFKTLMDLNRWKLPYTLDWMLMNHISITYVITSFSVFCIFAKMKPKGRAVKLIRFFSPAALGVYLIHVHPLIWKNWIPGLTERYAKSNWFVMLCQVLAVATAIFCACMAIDLIRILFFKAIEKAFSKLFRAIKSR